ncbi:MAG: FAD-dependent oxidoreductase [Victivallaceae bacterium]
MSVIKECIRYTPISGNYDVIVCGAGPAGVSAAIAAGRAGARTFLIEAKGCLGGIWTSGLLSWIIDHSAKDGLMKEFRDDLYMRNAVLYPDASSFAADVEIMKLMLEEKCIKAGVQLRLHSRVVAAKTGNDGNIEYIITESKSGREAWKAKVFIDATGDGDLGALAGCEFDFGHPESKLTQPMSLICLLTGVHKDKIEEVLINYNDHRKAKEALKSELKRGGNIPTYSHPSLFHVIDDLFILMANHQYKLSAINADDVTQATIMGRKEIHEQVNALKKLGGRWKNLRIIASAEQIGTREGRRLKGLHTLKAEDVINGTLFEDSVCRCNAGIDVHSTDPNKTQGIEPHVETNPYDIPLRALISRDRSNMLMAGRCISGDFIAHSSYRMTGTAVATGEAAGRNSAILCRK